MAKPRHRRAVVRNHGQVAGYLEELSGGFRFAYDRAYLAMPGARALSLTLPLRSEPFVSEHLFAFFYGLLSEGSTRALQARLLRIDEDDHFGLLVATGRDTIGTVTLEAGE